MRTFQIQGEHYRELVDLPARIEPGSFIWVGVDRDAFEADSPRVQEALLRWTGGQLFELHLADLLSGQFLSHFDYTSWYDLLIFRRLTTAAETARVTVAAGAQVSPGSPARALASIDTLPVGFAVFDHVLLTVHPRGCEVRDYFARRLQSQTAPVDARSANRVPADPADLAIRMVNHMVDSYLELRRSFSSELDALQQALLGSSGRFSRWRDLLEARKGMRILEDTCEDQRAAIAEWIDANEEMPAVDDPAVMRRRDLLRARSRDVLEHIERVLTHVRRLESSAENAVQMHFSTQNHRTNEIMRTLTVITAIFLPLNFVTGFFGMNFEGLPLIHTASGLWWTIGVMVTIGTALSWYFWRKRYIASLA